MKSSVQHPIQSTELLLKEAMTSTVMFGSCSQLIKTTSNPPDLSELIYHVTKHVSLRGVYRRHNDGAIMLR